jgi:hypothetical protein
VIPAINSNFSHHISAGLEDGTVITGQNSISHPSAPAAPPPSTNTTASPSAEVESPLTLTRRFSLELSAHDKVEDANLPGSLPTLRKQYIEFAKEHTEVCPFLCCLSDNHYHYHCHFSNRAQDLPSRIHKIWYINPYGQPIRPAPNPAVLTSLSSASAVIYSIGSLYTSILPCLILYAMFSPLFSLAPNRKT